MSRVNSTASLASPHLDEATPGPEDTISTTEAARRLGLAVRSVQMMVDRGELQAWKTPGGHRRILRASLESWLAGRGATSVLRGLEAPRSALAPTAPEATVQGSGAAPLRVLLIEDSAHFQNLVSLVVKRELPDAELHVAHDGISGLAMTGRLDPDILLVDILLPGIDGATLITSLRSHPQFGRCHLIVVTSLDEAQRAPYAFALDGVPVVHKPHLVTQLPALLAAAVQDRD
jgi:excisionase family DNA binding protein